MPYSNITTLNLIYSTGTFAPYDVFLEILIKSRENSFQTQAGRDTLRQQLVGALQVVAGRNFRFPANNTYVWSRNPTLSPVFEALLKATDTKNRIIEVEQDSSRPTTAETLNATQRVDDATVAIHNEIDRILSLLQGGTALYDRANFESASGWVWADAPVA
nr:coat protein [Hibiscus latent Hawaii virus]